MGFCRVRGVSRDEGGGLGKDSFGSRTRYKLMFEQALGEEQETSGQRLSPVGGSPWSAGEQGGPVVQQREQVDGEGGEVRARRDLGRPCRASGVGCGQDLGLHPERALVLS